MINFLTKNYAIVYKVEIKQLIEEIVDPRIRSIDVTHDTKRILIGTFSSELCFLETSDNKITKLTRFNCSLLMQSHYLPSHNRKDKIFGLAVMDDGDRFATVSEDATLRIWSTKNKKLEVIFPLNRTDDDQVIPADKINDSYRLTSIDIIKDGEFIAVGARDGTLRVIVNDKTKGLRLIQTIKNRNSRVNVIKFNPYKTLMAVGYEDNYIEVYLVPDFRRKFSQKKHSAPVTHLDWSRNSSDQEKSDYLQSNCAGQELLYFDFNNGKHLSKGGKDLRDYKWNTWTCIYGWPVQGIWLPDMKNMNEINMVDRSHRKIFDEYHLLAVADKYKKLRIYKYPCLKKGSEAVVGRGHSSSISNVRWSVKDEYLYTVGEDDGTVLIWKVDIV